MSKIPIASKKPTTQELSVYIAGVFAGLISEDKHGSISFAYDAAYRGVPLSMAMPVGLARYDDAVVRPYLMGLLPDDEAVRASIGVAYGVSGGNPFRLLRVIGLDCPGAVQVCNPKDVKLSENPAADLRQLSESEIAHKLRAVRSDAASAWVVRANGVNAGHWSLGGCQAKFALRKTSQGWCECAGAAATTHIFKPGVAGYENQALVEFLSMKIAQELGLPVAHVDYRLFEDEPAIIVERYDRIGDGSGGVRRIHQEDFCQALSAPPASKYAEQGGPAVPEIVSLLRKTGKNLRQNVYRFVLYLFFNYLLGATDAHAKNHSLLFVAEDDIRLAPLYDVASIAPYESLRPRQRRPLRAALSIGGENRFGMVGAEEIEKMVRVCNLDDLRLDAALLCERMQAMAKAMPGAVEAAFASACGRGVPGVEKVADKMKTEIEGNCERTLARL